MSEEEETQRIIRDSLLYGYAPYVKEGAKKVFFSGDAKITIERPSTIFYRVTFEPRYETENGRKECYLWDYESGIWDLVK